MQPTLTLEQRQKLLNECPGWRLVTNKDAIFKTFIFENFLVAFECMIEIAKVAENLNHHPEWLNVWNRLEITLSTHDSGGLTLKDIALAQAIETICQGKYQIAKG